MLNLLPWREQRARKKLYTEILLGVFLLGVTAACVEIGLYALKKHTQYCIDQKKSYAKKQLNKKNAIAEAKQVWQEYAELKKTVQAQVENQAQWHEVATLFAAIFSDQPVGLKVTDLTFDQHDWVISGHAQDLQRVTLYKNALEKHALQVELVTWLPLKKENFQLRARHVVS